jgi:hypothetical protein
VSPWPRCWWLPRGRSLAESTDEETARAIRDYLVRHPQAMDTAQGIAEWWLDGRADQRSVDRVLRRLTEDGTLESFGTGARARYRLKRRETEPP